MLFFIVILVLFVIPDVSYAWGPFTHLKLGVDILHTLQYIPSEVAYLISQHPYHFLYGTISADVIIWKNRIEYSHHCHNWKIAFSLLNSAYTEYLTAFSYGYLSHLAEDVIAHNIFVPFQMLKKYPKIKGKHLLWESIYDSEIDGRLWKVVKKIRKNVDTECDDFLEKNLKRALFSFKTNKRIFSSLLILNRTTSWQKKIESLSKGILPQEERNLFYTKSHHSAISVLKHKEKSLYTKFDPTGIKKIKEAEKLRHHWKKIEKKEKEKILYDILNLKT